MSRRISTVKLTAAAAIWALSLVRVPSASACSVCFGDPDSDLAKGAVAGVIVLGAVVYMLVFSFLGLTAFWYVRARRLAREIPSEPSRNP